MGCKIGEIFEYNGEWYQCVKSDGTCNGCVGKFQPYSFCNGFKECVGKIFKKLEKVGDPYLAHDHSRNKDVVVQDYKLYNQHACYNGHEEMLSFGFRGRNEIVTIKSKEPIKSLNCENSVEIQIEQNKEDMEESVEEKLFCDKVAKANAEYMKVKLNSSLKPFDIEAAKSGKPVYTRDGRKARIICFDRINGDYYKIVACVTAFDGDFEEVLFYGIDGYIVDSQNPKDEDLMMLPEKKEGWINICRNLNTNKTELDTKDIYNTKEEALQNLSSMTYVTTVKIEWEE